LQLYGYEQCKNKSIGLLLVACLALTADFLNTDYGYFGVLVIFIFHIFKEKKWLMYASYIALCLVKYLPLAIANAAYLKYSLIFVWSLVPLIFIHFYNGKKGVDTKYLLYGFYPVHLILLYLFHIFFVQ
jgi:hypothetical protein